MWQHASTWKWEFFSSLNGLKIHERHWDAKARKYKKFQVAFNLHIHALELSIFSNLDGLWFWRKASAVYIINFLIWNNSFKTSLLLPIYCQQTATTIAERKTFHDFDSLEEQWGWWNEFTCFWCHTQLLSSLCLKWSTMMRIHMS